MGGGRGGQKRGRTQRKHFRQNRENVWQAKKNRPDPSSSDNIINNNPAWEPFATQNLAFEEYYKEQGIVFDEEWDEFLSVLRKPLPAAFRINSSGQFFEDIRLQLENDFMKSLNAEVPNESGEEAISPLPWYHGNLAWHSNFSRMQLRKNQTLERFHEFLKQENEIGNITRQEAVSMVPPLFLDVHSDHCVLDMCAAPGSKTFQLLEIIHQSTEPGSLPDGMVIANDVDFRRCNLLIHQTKRMCSANLIVTNHEAQHFPSCHNHCMSTPKIGSTSGGLAGSPRSYKESNKPRKSQLLFDRILCDVPCSGDGTLRKAPDIWRKWNSGMGNGLHRLQVQIAMRGMALLKVGGRLVYSTCSMNPVENEAVVAEILRRSGESVELLDVSAELPQLIRRPGLKTWKVRDRGLWFASCKSVPSHRKAVIVPSMFPSGECWEAEETSSRGGQEDIGTPVIGNKEHQNGGDIHHDQVLLLSEEHDIGEAAIQSGQLLNNCTSSKDLNIECEDVSSLPLERCMRILPHDQNSGSFFIAVLHKISPFREKPSLRSYSSHKEHVFRDKLSKEMFDDKIGLEINLSEGAPREWHVNLAESVLNAGFQDQEESGMHVEIAPELDRSEACSEDKALEEAEACNDGENNGLKKPTEKGGSQIQGKWRGIDPVIFFTDDAIIYSIRAFYGINESFPFHGHLVTRNSDVHRVKRIYYISQSVQDVLKLNFQIGSQLKITSLGLKVFERQTSKEASSPCAFRISSEGLPLLLPYISKQIICAPVTDFEHLLRYRTVKFADFIDAGLGEKASQLMSGCCIVVLHKGDGPVPGAITVDRSTIAIGCWKGKTNLSVMVSQTECLELLERLSTCFGRQNGRASTLKTTHATSEAEPVVSVMDDNRIVDKNGETAAQTMAI